jgi:osmoprotectant transport system substrate-binding protein
MLRSRNALLLALPGAALLALTGCGTAEDAGGGGEGGDGEGPGAGQSITIGAADFGENIALAEVYKQKLEAEGFSVDVRQLSSREVIAPALEAGDLSLVPEYLATITDYLNTRQNGPDAESVISSDPEETLAALEPLAEEAGLVFYDYAEAQDQNAYVVTADFAEENGLETVSDLAEYSQENPVTLAGTPECRERTQCYLGLESEYGMNFSDDYITIDLSGFQGRERLESGDADVAVFLSSDGGLDDTLVVLEDDQGLNASDNIIPAVSAEAASPELEEALNAIHEALSQDELIELNRQVNNERTPAAQAASAFLEDNGLIDG